MALTAAGINSRLIQFRNSGLFGFNGLGFPEMATGMAQAISVWAVGNPANLALSGVAVGTAGAGTILPTSTKIVVPPNPVALQEGLAVGGITGPLSSSLAVAVTSGVSSAFSADAQYTGGVVGVGSGVDTASVTLANTPALVALLRQFLPGNGPLQGDLALGLGTGITNLLLLGTGAGTVIGTATPASAVGTSYSVVV